SDVCSSDLASRTAAARIPPKTRPCSIPLAWASERRVPFTLRIRSTESINELKRNARRRIEQVSGTAEIVNRCLDLVCSCLFGWRIKRRRGRRQLSNPSSACVCRCAPPRGQRHGHPSAIARVFVGRLGSARRHGKAKRFLTPDLVNRVADRRHAWGPVAFMDAGAGFRHRHSMVITGRHYAVCACTRFYYCTGQFTSFQKDSHRGGAGRSHLRRLFQRRLGNTAAGSFWSAGRGQYQCGERPEESGFSLAYGYCRTCLYCRWPYLLARGCMDDGGRNVRWLCRGAGFQACACQILALVHCCSRRSHVAGIFRSCIDGGRYWVRTSDPCRVKAVLYH